MTDDALDTTRPPVWSSEAEQAVLGACMLDPVAFERVGALKAEHFFAIAHRKVFAAIQSLARAGRPIDPLTVGDELGAEALADVGGTKYLQALTFTIGSAANTAAYASVVRDKAMLRALAEAADMAQQIVRGPGDANVIVDRVQSLFAAVQRTQAAPEPRRLAEHITARIDRWQALAAGEMQSGIPTHLSNLDEALGGGLRPGTVCVLGARPSVGKTSLATHIGLAVAAQGHAVLMLSQEMPAGDVADRVAARLGRVNLGRLVTGRFESDDWARIADMADSAAGLPFYVDDQPALTLLDIRNKARQVQRREGLALVIIDYVQLCGGTGPSDRRHHQIEAISRGLKVLAKEFNCAVLLLSQLNREGDRAEPELAHLKESGAIEEDADVVLLLHPVRQDADGSMLMLLKVPKNRQGRRGRLALAFDGGTQHWRQSQGDVSRRTGIGGE